MSLPGNATLLKQPYFAIVKNILGNVIQHQFVLLHLA